MSKEKQEVKEVKVEDSFKGMYAQFLKPFVLEALKVDSSRGFNLTSVNPQYIVERLNEVCGLSGWRHEGEYEEVTGGVIFKGRLVISIGTTGFVREAVGYAQLKKNVGDAYKSAKTDSLSKCASQAGIANDVFKGLVEPPVKKKPLKKVSNSNMEDF